MKRTLQDKIDRAVAMRDDAFHECVDAIREVVKDNGGFVDLQGKGRAPVRARVWSGANDDYIDNAVLAVRLNGTDESGADIIEAFCHPRLPVRVTKEAMEDPENDESWLPVSVDDERIFPMDPVFELAYLIEDYVNEAE